jgi:putative transposase
MCSMRRLILLNPQRREQLAHTLMADHGISERTARSTLRYRSVPRDDSGVIIFIHSHMALNPRHGFDLL